MNEGDNMKEGKLVPATIETRERSGRPSVEQFKAAQTIRIIDCFGEYYELKWRYNKRPSHFSLEITGGMFGNHPEIKCLGYDLNTVNNAPEVILALASGEEKVRVLLGKYSSKTEPCYVQLNVVKVELQKE